MKYLALLYTVLLKVLSVVVAELATVVVASDKSLWSKVAPAVANESVPAPSVFINCPDEPSVVGKVNPLIVTPPEPFPDSSRLAFEEFVLTWLSSIVICPSVKACVTVNVVNVPAAAVDPPITVPSIAPLFMSAFAITTEPVPDGDNIKSELDAVALIWLSVILMLSSIVRLLTITDPVPPGVRRMSAFELEDIVLSLKLKLSTVTPPLVKVIAPVTVNDPKVERPDTVNVPVVDKFSLPKLMAPDESVIDPPAIVKVPVVNVLSLLDFHCQN
jgi:Flp pilus assembly pilin Flp